jgi:branched-chain amino acid transport system substrate-binding protein
MRPSRLLATTLATLALSLPGAVPAADAIVLGVPTALGTLEGADSLRAAQLAVKEINDAGGVQVGKEKRKLEIASIDTREAEAGVPVNDALAAMEKLIGERKPAAIVVGAFRSEVLVSAMDMIAKAKIPYLATIGMSGAFDQKIAAEPEKYRHSFRLSLSGPFLVGNMAKVMEFMKRKHGFDKVYFLHQDVAWAKGTIGALAKVAEAAGWKVLGNDGYPTGSRDFSASLTKAKAGGAQLLVPLFDMPEGGVLVKQARSMRVPAVVSGFISPAAPATAWTTFKGDIEGLVEFLFEPGSIPLPTPRSQAFHEAYGKVYGEGQRDKLAGHGPGPSYDAVYVLAKAMERAGTTDADKVVAELEKTDMDGVVGHLVFNKTHGVPYGDDLKTGGVSLAFQWRNGKRVVVFPEGVAQGQIELPAR